MTIDLSFETERRAEWLRAAGWGVEVSGELSSRLVTGRDVQASAELIGGLAESTRQRLC
jgi:hypothetical protein